MYPSKLLEKQRGLSRNTVSNIVIVYNLGAICGGVTFGAWSQVIGRRRAIVTAALLSLPMIPAWAFATNPWRIALAAFLMQFCVQGGWGVVPAHLNELSPGSVRGTFPGLAYQLGNLLAASTGNIQTWLAGPGTAAISALHSPGRSRGARCCWPRWRFSAAKRGRRCSPTTPGAATRSLGPVSG